jgi:hypothetical protein
MKPKSLKKYRDEEQSHKKWLAAYRRAITKANKLKTKMTQEIKIKLNE